MAKRRIFIRARNKVCQIFTFAQEPDGSIYCFFPDFADAKWLIIQNIDEGLHLISAEAIGPGKVSFHGSGAVHVRPDNDPRWPRLKVKGNPLLNMKKESVGMRHLFTVFMKQPEHEPKTSHLFNRPSDYCLEANEILKPLILVFFAVPQKKGVIVDFQFSIHVNDLVNTPNDILGMHGFGLRYHDVIWFAYRTRFMEGWPKQAHVCYLDGSIFPIFVGAGPGVFRLEYRQPQYFLNNSKLTIGCHQVYQYDHSVSQIRYCCEDE